MSKINIKVSINDVENIVKGIIQDDILKYTIKPYKTKFNYKTNTIINETEETRLEIAFNEKETIGKLLYKPTNTKMNLDIKTKRIIKNNYNIEIEYEIEEQKYVYRIEEIK